LLDRLSQAAQQAGWIHEQIQVLALQALALQALAVQRHEQIAQAVETLSHALALAEPGGYLCTLLDHGPPMVQLLHQAARHKIHTGYVETLLAAAASMASACPPTPDLQPQTPPSQPLVEPLSGREIQVLTLIAEGLTNREVAERLYISQGTVKAHTSNIFGKLGVRSRTQAVARARALSILQ
jgi:LuxR family maltose regulon positive regulatory protein